MGHHRPTRRKPHAEGRSGRCGKNPVANTHPLARAGGLEENEPQKCDHLQCRFPHSHAGGLLFCHQGLHQKQCPCERPRGHDRDSSGRSVLPRPNRQCARLQNLQIRGHHRRIRCLFKRSQRESRQSGQSRASQPTSGKIPHSDRLGRHDRNRSAEPRLLQEGETLGPLSRLCAFPRLARFRRGLV